MVPQEDAGRGGADEGERCWLGAGRTPPQASPALPFCTCRRWGWRGCGGAVQEFTAGLREGPAPKKAPPWPPSAPNASKSGAQLLRRGVASRPVLGLSCGPPTLRGTGAEKTAQQWTPLFAFERASTLARQLLHATGEAEKKGREKERKKGKKEEGEKEGSDGIEGE